MEDGGQNIELGLRNKGIRRDERQGRVEQAIALMNLQGYEGAFPHQLSGAIGHGGFFFFFSQLRIAM